MTKFMEFELYSYFILKILSVICGLIGAFGAVGIVGGHEWGLTTSSQFWLYEFYMALLIGLAYLMYRVSKYVRADYIRRDTRNK